MSTGSAATAAVLAGAALACALALAARPAPGAALLRASAAVLVALSLAYALNADVWLLKHGRAAAQEAGLYAWRRPLQAALSVLLLLAAVGVAACIARRAQRPQPRPAAVPWAAAVAAAAATAAALFGLRAVSLHGVDAVLDWRCFGVGFGRWLEWSAGAVALLGALLQARAASGAGVTPNQPLRAWRPHV